MIRSNLRIGTNMNIKTPTKTAVAITFQISIQAVRRMWATNKLASKDKWIIMAWRVGNIDQVSKQILNLSVNRSKQISSSSSSNNKMVHKALESRFTGRPRACLIIMVLMLMRHTKAARKYSKLSFPMIAFGTLYSRCRRLRFSLPQLQMLLAELYSKSTLISSRWRRIQLEVHRSSHRFHKEIRTTLTLCLVETLLPWCHQLLNLGTCWSLSSR